MVVHTDDNRYVLKVQSVQNSFEILTPYLQIYVTKLQPRSGRFANS